MSLLGPFETAKRLGGCQLRGQTDPRSELHGLPTAEA